MEKAEEPACRAVVRMEDDARIRMVAKGKDVKEGMIVCMLLYRRIER